MSSGAAVSRRDFLASSGTAVLAAGAVSTHPGSTSAGPKPDSPAKPARPLRVAAINSIYRLRSHSDHICGRMIHGFTWNGLHHQPEVRLVRMYNHQTPDNDLGRRVCKQYDIELCDSVEQALGGENGLDVDAVLLIIEHGDYPVNDREQVLYPRYEMFERITSVFRKAGRSVPVFCDKHLSYDHVQAANMLQTSRDLGFGLMAGSSLPVTWRIPEIEPPVDTPFTEGLVTYGFDRGAIDIYLFHALESLQVFMERRRGGESGVKSLQMLRGDAVWQAATAGRWSWKLMEAALANCQSLNIGPIKKNVADPLAVLIEYQDGTRGTILNLIEQTSEFGFAGTVAGREDPLACCLYLPSPPAANFFNPLTWHIEQFFHRGQPTAVERTLLTTTMCDFALRSLFNGQQPVSSPALQIAYQPPASTGFARGSWTNLLPARV
jgi:hypothetical protein